MIIAELEQIDTRKLLRLGIIVVSIDAKDYPVLFDLRKRYPKPGLNDLTALAIAKQKNISLITGDGALREAAKAEGVQAVGVLWVLDRLVEEQVINCERAALALESMLRNNARLPKAECHKRLSKWRKA